MSFLDELPYLDINTELFMTDRNRFMNEARDAHPIYRSERGVEILAYEPQWTILRDNRLAQDQAGMVQESGVSHPYVLRNRNTMLQTRLGQDHMRLRSIVAPYFAKQYTEKLRPVIRGFIDRLLDELVEQSSADKPVIDLFNGVCQRLPAIVYAHLVGAPLSDEDFVRRISTATMLIGERDPELAGTVESAYLELFEFTEERFRAIEEGGAPDGPLSGLLEAIAEGKLTRVEAVDLTALLLEASTDNTTHEMALIAAVLLENREQWNELVNDPSLIPRAIEEAMRLRPRALQNERRAFESFEWLGDTVPAGTTFVLSTIGANLDPKAYPEPETLDFHRQKPPLLVMFGGGMQACLGAGLARVEFQEWVAALVTRFPNMTLAEPARVKFNVISTEALNLDVIVN